MVLPLQVILQDFAWTESQKDERLALRDRTLKALGFEASDQPLYCFESTIKCFYFSSLIYEYEDVRPPALLLAFQNISSLQTWWPLLFLEYDTQHDALVVIPTVAARYSATVTIDTISCLYLQVPSWPSTDFSSQLLVLINMAYCAHIKHFARLTHGLSINAQM